MSFAPTVEDLAVLVATWQRRLRLEDWIITASFSSELKGCRGQVQVYGNLKTADMEILDPSCRTAREYEFTSPERLEHTVVHELLHLHFALFCNEKQTMNIMLEEQVVECIAQALTVRRQLKLGEALPASYGGECCESDTSGE